MSVRLCTRTCASTRWPVVATPELAQRTAPGLAAGLRDQVAEAAARRRPACRPPAPACASRWPPARRRAAGRRRDARGISGCRVSGLMAEKASVWPSGACARSASMPTLPPAPRAVLDRAPARRSACDSGSASARAMPSLHAAGRIDHDQAHRRDSARSAARGRAARPSMAQAGCRHATPAAATPAMQRRACVMTARPSRRRRAAQQRSETAARAGCLRPRARPA